jgi:hypothetical protein
MYVVRSQLNKPPDHASTLLPVASHTQVADYSSVVPLLRSPPSPRPPPPPSHLPRTNTSSDARGNTTLSNLTPSTSATGIASIGEAVTVEDGDQRVPTFPPLPPRPPSYEHTLLNAALAAQQASLSSSASQHAAGSTKEDSSHKARGDADDAGGDTLHDPSLPSPTMGVTPPHPLVTPGVVAALAAAAHLGDAQAMQIWDPLTAFLSEC